MSEEDKTTAEVEADAVEEILCGLDKMNASMVPSTLVSAVKVASYFRDHGYFEDDDSDESIVFDQILRDKIFTVTQFLLELPKEVDGLGTYEEWQEAERSRDLKDTDWISEP